MESALSVIRSLLPFIRRFSDLCRHKEYLFAHPQFSGTSTLSASCCGHTTLPFSFPLACSLHAECKILFSLYFTLHIVVYNPLLTHSADLTEIQMDPKSSESSAVFNILPKVLEPSFVIALGFPSTSQGTPKLLIFG